VVPREAWSITRFSFGGGVVALVARVPIISVRGSVPGLPVRSAALHSLVKRFGRNLAMVLDALDRHILALYQADTRVPCEQIGAQVGLSAAAVQRRLKRLRETGVIVAETAAVDCRQLGLDVTALVHVDLVDESAHATRAFRDKVVARGEVQQCYGVTGAADYVLVVVVTNLKPYDAFCEDCLLHDANVRSFSTQIVLDAAKRGSVVHIPET
jgi:Lrp/AsnC family transcriptional regulator, leucine-responsive regulatory protein